MNTRFKDFVNEARKYKVQFPITTGVGVEYEDVNREVEIKKFAIIGEIFDLDSVTGTIGKNNYELDFGKSMAGGMSVFLTTWGDRIQKKVGRNFFGDTYEGTDKWNCFAVIGDPEDNNEKKFEFDYCPTINKKNSNKNDPYNEEDWGDNCDFKQFEININNLKKKFEDPKYNRILDFF